MTLKRENLKEKYINIFEDEEFCEDRISEVNVRLFRDQGVLGEKKYTFHIGNWFRNRNVVK